MKIGELFKDTESSDRRLMYGVSEERSKVLQEKMQKIVITKLMADADAMEDVDPNTVGKFMFDRFSCLDNYLAFYFKEVEYETTAELLMIVSYAAKKYMEAIDNMPIIPKMMMMHEIEKCKNDFIRKGKKDVPRT